MTMTATPGRAGGRRFVLHGVKWTTYESLLGQLSRQQLFLTYCRGTLEMMAPSYSHNKSSRLFYNLVHTMAQEFDVPIASAGTTTFRKRDLKIGLEADETFYLRNEQGRAGLEREIKRVGRDRAEFAAWTTTIADVI